MGTIFKRFIHITYIRAAIISWTKASSPKIVTLTNIHIGFLKNLNQLFDIFLYDIESILYCIIIVRRIKNCNSYFEFEMTSSFSFSHFLSSSPSVVFEILLFNNLVIIESRVFLKQEIILFIDISRKLLN